MGIATFHLIFFIYSIGLGINHSFNIHRSASNKLARIDSSAKMKENELLIRVVFRTPTNRMQNDILKSCLPKKEAKNDTCNIIIVMIKFIMENIGKIPQWAPNNEPQINDEGFKTMTYC
ncbi:hypothetical protein DdX_06069 [Ditylenchus destructor]|uniref:Uncharacterized protein n=1 Tax=Ditylenchus destructor TaxID=166010 RepID=A0AAD4NBR2_9BILA|nr:hypothetical protein DdX_06069 [Ditylenchus destructor]